MADNKEKIKPSKQAQYHEPRHPIFYIILYCIGNVLLVPMGLTLILLSLVGISLSGESSYVTILLFLTMGGIITIIGPLIIILFFLKKFKTSRYKKYYLIPLIAIPAILIIAFIFILF